MIKTRLLNILRFLSTASDSSKILQSYYRRINCTLEKKIAYDCFDYPAYAFGLYHAARQAKAMGFDRFSAVEFGVAGGNGVLALQKIAKHIKARFGLTVDIFGFDFGSGLSKPKDFRDLPYAWKEGMFKMDEPMLRERLSGTLLYIGDVVDTIDQFSTKNLAGPVGFISFDLDYYSSTKSAFKIFSLGREKLLPRVFCYFDDIIGLENEYHCDRVGELAAIKEYNESATASVLAPIHGLKWKRAIKAQWNECVYVFHSFDHPMYNDFLDFAQLSQAPLSK